MGGADLIHRFGDPLPLDAERARRWLGGKGASVAEMTRMGLPVPPGFTISTDCWRHFDAHGALPTGLFARVREEVERLGEPAGGRFGQAGRPLLLAVRSGGPSSMPGMLDTVLDVGVDPEIARALASSRGQPRFGADLRRRFVESYATVVLGVPRDAFDALLGRRDPRELDPQQLEELLVEYERLVRHEAGEAIPDDPWQQLQRAIEGVLRSWRSPRAQKYREAHGIADDEGTGVTVQAMVYGNLGPRSGAGVAFSRNPSTGERELFGEWLPRSQGEDVVGGRRTPDPLTRAQVRRGMEDRSLESLMPEALQQIRELCERLEERFGDVQDVEFALEEGQLYVLQCRSAKRTARAAARVAVEMVDEGMLTRTEALARLEPGSLRQLLTPRLPDPQTLSEWGLSPLARGLAASPGAATGRIVFDADAVVGATPGEELILVRAETSAEDVETMRLVGGILTTAGGLTSHAAVVARAMGKPCVAGATSLHVDYARRLVVSRAERGGSLELSEGDTVTIDGGRGLVYAAAVPVEPAPASPHVESILTWADEVRDVQVWSDATTARLARVGRSFGADAIAVTRPAAEPLERLIEAVGEGPLAVAVPLDRVEAAAARLRPGRDRILVGAAELAAAREALGGREIGLLAVIDEPQELRRAADGVEGYLVTIDEVGDAEAIEALGPAPDRLLILRGDAADDPRSLAAFAPDRPLAVVSPPLDVAVVRLRVAQADRARRAKKR